MKDLLFSILVVAGLAAPAAAQDTPLTKLLSRVFAPASTSGTDQPRAGQSYLAKMTDEQQKALKASLQVNHSDVQIREDFKSAGELVEQIVQTAACGKTNAAWNALNRRATQPLTSTMFETWTDTVARGDDKYHDPQHCYDVIRLTELRKPAANALQFGAYMVSPDSQKGVTKYFTLIRLDGQWLIKGFGY